mmetsp:Transcript_14296/g.35566  ORF Transcript_14296/g.35566 Transcript_14296/m.35566 type:complete len:218 (-) Transcript_14296:1322-1975(-)
MQEELQDRLLYLRALVCVCVFARETPIYFFLFYIFGISSSSLVTFMGRSPRNGPRFFRLERLRSHATHGDSCPSLYTISSPSSVRSSSASRRCFKSRICCADFGGTTVWMLLYFSAALSLQFSPTSSCFFSRPLPASSSAFFIFCSALVTEYGRGIAGLFLTKKARFRLWNVPVRLRAGVGTILAGSNPICSSPPGNKNCSTRLVVFSPGVAVPPRT